MRLIDADELIEWCNGHKGQQTCTMAFLADWIKCQPTAFDVDEVVEQLDSLRPHGMVPLVDGFIKDAIETVKKGGIE
jgi:hypothetical protein